MANLFEPPGTRIVNTGICAWCRRGAVYDGGTKCMHGPPPRECPAHGKWTDLNLVARGRRAVVKCTHYGNAAVVLYADPIADDKEHGTYTLQFYIPGVGQELYTIPPNRNTCPHMAYDMLVKDMQNGARPSANRVPPPTSDTAQPGHALGEDHGS